MQLSLNDKQSAMESSQREIAESRSTVARLSQEKEQMSAQVANLSQHLSREQEQNKKLAQEFQANRGDLGQQLTSLQAELAVYRPYKESLESLQQEKESWRAERESLTTELQSRSFTKNQLEMEIARLQTDVKEKQDRTEFVENILKTNQEQILLDLNNEKLVKDELYKKL